MEQDNNNKKIKLVLSNIWAHPNKAPHFGLASLAAFVRNQNDNIDIKIIEGTDPYEAILKENPDILGLSSDTLVYKKTIDLAYRIKKDTRAKIIIGGVHISALPDSFANCFDVGVLNEGEHTLTELVEFFLKDRLFDINALKGVKGILFWENGHVYKTKPRQIIKNIDSLPFPARDLTPMNEYYLKDQFNLFGVKKVATILTSRGCPYRCVFCGSPAHWGQVRWHSPEYVVSEIKHLVKNYDIDGIMFWDDLFIAPKERIKKIADLIIKEGLHKKLTFWGYARSNLIDEEICQLLASMSVKRLIFGFESGSQKILSYLKNNSVSIEDNKRASILCRKHKITTSSGYIVGTPGETVQDLEDSYNFMKKYPLDNTQVYILTPYPGTAVWQQVSNRMTKNMDFEKLFVQLSTPNFYDYLLKNKVNILSDRVFLNTNYKNNEQYLQLIFKMTKLAQIQNILFYIKITPKNIKMLLRFLTKKIKNIFIKESFKVITKNNKSKKILVSGLTLENATLSPFLNIAKYWINQGLDISFVGTRLLQERINLLKIISDFKMVIVKNDRMIDGNWQLIFQGIKRNFSALYKIKEIKNKYHIIHSPSSVLDLVIYPWFLKKVDKNIRWSCVFDNTVPFKQPGNILTRALSWSFFHISLSLIKKADLIFTVTEDLKEYLIQKGFKPESIVITQNSVDGEAIKKATKKDQHKTDALFIGRLHPAKGIYDMLEVLKIVKQRIPAFKLTVVGQGDKKEEKKFRQKISELGLNNNISLLGVKTGAEKYDIIKSSRMFWFLSVNESFGIAPLEAVCSGVPTIVYNLDIYKGIYKKNEVFSFEIGDYNSIGDQTINIFENNISTQGNHLLEQYGDFEKIGLIQYQSFLKLC